MRQILQIYLHVDHTEHLDAWYMTTWSPAKLLLCCIWTTTTSPSRNSGSCCCDGCWSRHQEQFDQRSAFRRHRRWRRPKQWALQPRAVLGMIWGMSITGFWFLRPCWGVWQDGQHGIISGTLLRHRYRAEKSIIKSWDVNTYWHI